MAPSDDYVDPLGDEAAEMEARFRKLEEEAEMDDLRRRAGVPDGAPAGAPKSETPSAGPDPLKDLKAALDSDDPVERYLLAICPSCQGKNRISMTKVRTADPICGSCKEPLTRV